MILDESSIIAAFYTISAIIATAQQIIANPQSCPINCKCEATTISCSGASISDASFEQIPLKVEHLDLSKNSLKLVPEPLTLYKNIITLNLSLNELSSIPQYAFSDMWKLKTLDLSGNRIKSLSDIDASSIFTGNTKLQFLNLSSNPLTDLGEDYDRILYSESILSVDLSHCSIRVLQGPIVLQGLAKLTHLNLSFNPIVRLEGLTSKSLTSLDISYCNIQFFRSDSFVYLPQLQYLYANGNAHLSDQFYKPESKSLAYVYASYCNLNTNYASELPETKTLVQKGNQMKHLQAYIFQNNTRLEVLDLSENIIKYIDEFAFYGVESLRYLDLSHNSITVIGENTFTFTPNLLDLNLSQNTLKSLEPLKASSLRALDLSKCELQSIDWKTLISLPSLHALNASYNYLETIPKNLTSYSVEILDISYCRITLVEKDDFNRLPQLTEVNLTGNRLVYVRNDTFTAPNKLNHVALSNNPWKCDCYDENFKLLWRHLNTISDTSTLLCWYPANVTKQTWEEACTDAWNPSHRKSKDIIILTVIVIVLLLSGIVACVVAIKESYSSRTHRTRVTGEAEVDGNQRGNNADHVILERNNEIRESMRKFTQLPSYDEALLLPRPPSSSFSDAGNNTLRLDKNEKSRKRQSATQTEETIEALLQEIGIDDENESGAPIIRRNSLQEMEYIRIQPLSLQCTEL